MESGVALTLSSAHTEPSGPAPSGGENRRVFSPKRALSTKKAGGTRNSPSPRHSSAFTAMTSSSTSRPWIDRMPGAGGSPGAVSANDFPSAAIVDPKCPALPHSPITCPSVCCGESSSQIFLG